MTTHIKTKQTDSKAINKIVTRYSSDYKINVGYPSTVKSTRYPSGEQVTAVAYINEYGTKNIPSRPFMKNAIKPSIKAVQKISQIGMSAINSGNITELNLIEQTGAAVASVHKKTITDLRNPPNKQSTIKRKKSSNPLIDTALMRNTLTYIVKKI